jgi:hypothetical protein
MARLSDEHAKIEARLHRAIEKALRKWSANVSLYDLSVAIQRKDVEAVLRLYSQERLADALVPVSKIMEDAVMRGGRLMASRLAKKLAKP